MTETETAAPTCATCGQTLTPWTNTNGVELLVADDGWGTICGGAPRGMHVPAADAPRGVLVDPYDDDDDDDDGSWPCGMCDEVAESEEALVDHIDDAHPGADGGHAPACEACSDTGSIMVEVEAVDGKPLGYREIDCPECR
jgi:hypothetical protein